jgi:hypothetical protein
MHANPYRFFFLPLLLPQHTATTIFFFFFFRLYFSLLILGLLSASISHLGEIAVGEALKGVVGAAVVQIVAHAGNQQRMPLPHGQEPADQACGGHASFRTGSERHAGRKRKRKEKNEKKRKKENK